jgi:signal transduction histidine kinase
MGFRDAGGWAKGFLSASHFFLVVVLLSLGISVFGALFFLRENLLRSADQYTSELQRQLALDLQNGDVSQLMRRLGALGKNQRIICLKGEKSGIEFYREEHGSCGNGFFQAKRGFSHSAHEISLAFTWRQETLLTFSFFGFFLLQSLLGTGLVVLFRLRQQKLFESELAMAELARQVAHDIRSPLAILRSLLSGQPKSSVAFGALARLQELGEVLLESKKSPRFLSFGHLIREVVAQKQTEYMDRVDLITELDPALFSLYPPQPAFHWQRVFSNLLNNGAEAGSSNDGLTIRITSEAGSEGHTISIIDNGSGMDEHSLNEWRKGRKVTTKAAGFGLGLKSATEWMKDCGGNLEIESQGGVGTTVRMHLAPLSSKAHFVDNDPQLRLLWKKAAQRVGIDLQTYGSWSEFQKNGLSSWHKSEPLFLDFDLGEGPLPVAEVEKELRNRPGGGRYWVYLSSGYSPEKFRKLAWVAAVVGKEPPWELFDPNGKNR